jgi:hypothetical protein
VRQQRVGDIGVVLEQVALGDPVLRPEDLPEVREPHGAAIDGELGVGGVAGNDE